MRKLIAIAAAGLLAACARTAPEATADTKAVTKGWGDNFAAAQAQAKATGRPIFALFTGSDWCGWCIRLHKEVFDEREFQKFAANNLVLFEADFPRSKQLKPEVVKQNEALSQKYGVRGFPTIHLLDAEGKTLAQTGYQRGGAKAYVTHLEELFAKAGLKVQTAEAAKTLSPYEKMKAEKAAAEQKAAETTEKAETAVDGAVE